MLLSDESVVVRFNQVIESQIKEKTKTEQQEQCPYTQSNKQADLTAKGNMQGNKNKQPILVQGEVRRPRSAMEEEPRDGCLLLSQRTRRPSAPLHTNLSGNGILINARRIPYNCKEKERKQYAGKRE
jgi:hypothetical protein